MNGSYGSNIESSRNYSNYGKTVPLKILSANQENWITTDFPPFLASAFLNFCQLNEIIELISQCFLILLTFIQGVVIDANHKSPDIYY